MNTCYKSQMRIKFAKWELVQYFLTMLTLQDLKEEIVHYTSTLLDIC